MKTLFDRTSMIGMELKNRIFRSATWDGLAAPDGSLTEEIYSIYRELAAGGTGVIVTGLTDVSPYNWALTGNMRLCSDHLIPDYQRLVKAVREHDCRILVQLNMDRYVRPEKRPVPVGIDELTDHDMEDIVRLFKEAALRADQAGFDGVQIHLAYNWLLNRMLQPYYNHRTDSYGGTAENRAGLAVRIIGAVKDAAPKMHISVKFSFYEEEDETPAIDDCVKICRVLEENGAGSLEILGGHSPKEKNPRCEACYLEYALAAKKHVKIPVILTGGNHDIANMEKLLNEEGIEYFGMSRPLICEPGLPERWRKGDRIRARCVSCGKCYETHGKRCIFK